MTLKYNCVDSLVRFAGVSHADAIQLRRISMTLHRWYEMETDCGNDFSSACVVRGKKTATGFEYADDGKPYIERHNHRGDSKALYSRINDRETGAIKRLDAIMANYPTLSYYLQTDCRGAALYVMRPGDVPEGATVDSCYSRGICVCQ